MNTEIERAFKAELTRLLARGLTTEQEEIARRYYSQKERDSMDESSFCGPHRSFPITSQEDVNNAAHLVGHADNPDSVRRCIISKAKSHGWSLPASWEEKETSESPEFLRADVSVSADGSHEKTTGSHDHKHPAYGEQGADDTHGHSHSHDGDNSHHHTHSDTNKANSPDILRTVEAIVDSMSEEADILRSMPSETSIFAPIIRIDQQKREVILRATAEDLDSYKTVITFDGSKEAFKKWRGNIREMHDHTKAVGRALKVDPVDNEKAIDITLRVSRGAEDTWQKVLDGTLGGASIGARNGKWENRMWKGEMVPHLISYDLVEVSLVDNPSCPGCDIKLVRMDGANLAATDILDNSEDVTVAPSTPEPPIDRRGARVATNTMASMHRARDHAFNGIREMLANCSCDQCASALRVIDPDNDGDIDILSATDTDHDAQKLMGNAAAGDGSGIMKFVETEIVRQLTPSIQRMNGIAARLSSVPSSPTSEDITRLLESHIQEINQKPDPDITRRMDTLESKLSELDEVRSVLTKVAGLVERIAQQPMGGGPIVNSSLARMGASDASQPDMAVLEAEIIQRLARSGILSHDQQVNAALHLQKQSAARR